MVSISILNLEHLFIVVTAAHCFVEFLRLVRERLIYDVEVESFRNGRLTQFLDFFGARGST